MGAVSAVDGRAMGSVSRLSMMMPRAMMLRFCEFSERAKSASDNILSPHKQLLPWIMLVILPSQLNRLTRTLLANQNSENACRRLGSRSLEGAHSVAELMTFACTRRLSFGRKETRQCTKLPGEATWKHCASSWKQERFNC